MKFKLFTSMLIAASLIMICLLGGCGNSKNSDEENSDGGNSSGENSGDVRVTAINIEFDQEYFLQSGENRIEEYGLVNGGIYDGLYEYFLYTSNVGIGDIDYDINENLVILSFARNVPLKLNIKVLPEDATNKNLSYSAVKIEQQTGAITDDTIDIDDYINIATDGTVTLKDTTVFSNGDTIKVTVITTDGSGTKYIFYVRSFA